MEDVPDGNPFERECQFLRSNGIGNLWRGMFCARASAVAKLIPEKEVKTPGGGILEIAQYDFHAQVCGSLRVRFAILLVGDGSGVAEETTWQTIAKHILKMGVRIVAGRFENKDHPLLLELKELIDYTLIATAPGSQHHFCLLGGVGDVKGDPTDVHSRSAVVKYSNWGRFHSITVRTPREIIPYTVKGLISVNGFGSNRRSSRVQQRSKGSGDRQKQRQTNK